MACVPILLHVRIYKAHWHCYLSSDFLYGEKEKMECKT